MKGLQAVHARRLVIGGRIDRYVGTLFVSSYATSFLVVVGLVFLMDLAANIDELMGEWDGGGSPPGSLLVRYYLLNLPFLFLQAAPFVTLTAGVFTVSRLLRHNEIAACLAAGVSARRVVAPVIVGGILAAGAMFLLREWMAATIAHQRDAVLYVLREHSYDRVYRDIWVRDPDGNFARLAEFRPAFGDPPIAEVRGLRGTVRALDQVVNIEAERMVFVERDGEAGWWMKNGVRYVVGDESDYRDVDWLEEIQFTPEMILAFHRAQDNPLELSFGEAVALARRDPDNVMYQTLMQYHLTFPLANVVLLLVGLPLLMRHERARGVEGLAKSLLLCMFYFGADFIFRNLGIQGAIDPLLASWAPVLLFGSLGVVLFDSMRT